MKGTQKHPALSTLAAILAVFYSFVTLSMAAPPDLTNGGVPDASNSRTFNLGPTGMRGWVYYLSGNQADSSDSRQILVTHVESGSPASGIIAVNDVILGADGTGANPVNFSSDARKSLAYAIQDAEARSPATLKLLRWRAGTTTTVTLTLQTMGAYTATAPYNCPKSALILEQGLDYVYNNEGVGNYSFGGLTLLTTGDPAHLAKAQTAARALASSQSYLNQLKADEPDLDTSLPTWDRGHKLLFLAEYYLATNDAQVLPAVEAYALNVCKNRSLFGTFGHGFADWRNGSIGAYGPVNSAGMPCMLGLLLAKECGLTNPEIDPAIAAANSFYSWYSGKGGIPYGEHDPYMAHETNGKSGLGAVYFGLQASGVEQGKYFAKMCTAATSEREIGHTGAFFNYLWAPLGAAQGGEQAAAAHFSRISWMLDLNRGWDGRFVYDCLNGEGPVSSPSDETYYDFKMSTAALLTYALPHRKLRITGKGHDASRWLTSADVTEAHAAEDYDPASRSNSQLIADLGNWSAVVRQQAAEKLGTNGVSGAELSQITALATDTNGSSGNRSGACFALGEIGNSGSSGVLAGLLTDADNYVRYSSAVAMRQLHASTNLTHLNTVLAAAASTAAPLDPLSEDPQQLAHCQLSQLLFGSGGIIYGNSLGGVDRNLLYPAIRAVAATPNGAGRSALENTYPNLTEADVQALSATIVDSVVDYAPANRMFSHGVRYGGVSALYQHNIAEGVPACKRYAETTWGGIRTQPLGWLGSFGGSVHTVTPDPGVVPYLQTLTNDWEVGEFVQDVIAQIAADTDPTQLIPLKSIQSATADQPVLTLPASSTVLRVTGFDHMQGDSIYTWSKLSGPGAVTFTPNGTSATASTAQFDGTAGTYQFEVKMSDSRGFTEVTETVTVFVITNGEVDNNPPVPDPASFAVAPTADSETAVSMTAVTGADVTGPVEYLFSETTGNPGGSSSGWQSSPTYTDTGLSPVTQYAYTVTMRDSLGNTGTTSSAVSVTTSGTPPATDIISVNFYGYGALDPADYSAVTLEADESAGFGGWNTAGWQNRPTNNAGPVSITSGLGASATLTVNNVRNGGPYAWKTAHVLLADDGNGDLMDGHCNGTEDDGPGDSALPAKVVDITISNVSFGSYDVIVYVGGNRDQYGDGTGKYVVNGGAEQNFTLTSGEFHTFSQIANASTPGNYLLFQNLTGSTFTLQMWGNGFNHIGPTGFQIAKAGTTSDIYPPTPNPASFAVAPFADGTNAISMTATTGSDASGPVEYLFSCLTPGGNGSGWQSSPSYTDSGLTPDTQYTYTVTMRDARGNTGSASDPVSGWASSGGADTTAPNPNPMTWAVAPATEGGGASGISYVQITSDADSGISNGNTYTHAIDFGTSGTATVNGVVFANDVNATAGGRSNQGARSYGPNPHAGNTPPAVSGGVVSLFTDMRYNGPDLGYIELTGLTPGQWYDLRLYERAFGYQGVTRTFYVGYDVGSDGSEEYTTPKINQDDPALATPGLSGDVSYAISYVYQADGSGKIKVTIDLADDQNGSYHLYGLTNQEVSGIGGDPETEISMTASTATDISGVKYYFTETSGNPGGSDSGWQDSPVYVDTGLNPGTQYTYTVMARDRSANLNATAPSVAASATTSGGSPGDTTPPTPNPASFALAPTAGGSSSVSMTATIGSDASGVEYLFTETSGNAGGTSSGWQASASYTDSGLSASTTYSYTVTMRDGLGNTGSASGAASATTSGSGGVNLILNWDFEAGMTNWGSWNNPVVTTDSYQGSSAIKMVDKGSIGQWVNVEGNTTYTLSAYLKTSDATKKVVLGVTGSDTVNIDAVDVFDTQYTLHQITFTTAVGETSVEVWAWQPPSGGASAYVDNMSLVKQVTPPADTDPPTPNPASFASAPVANSSSSISMTATTGSDASGPVEYLFTETSGNPGGSSSGWQTSASYTDSGLSASTQYTYTITMRDSLGNTGTASSGASATTQSGGGQEITSVNFYAYGGFDPADYDKVTLEAGETAGVGAYNTNGWENFEVPFGLSSPMTPVTVTGTLGSTASLTLNDVRNGWTHTSTPHVNFPGDGNGDLMDGHCNGTEDPYDQTAMFDMEVTGITHSVYDVIVYLGANDAQFGDGKGKIVLNGGAEQDFTLTSGEFAGFVEITDATTPGNYVVFTGLTSATLTLKVWGNGFNHLGPAGFQIVSGGGSPGPDTTPPTPNPASFASAPAAGGDTTISMTATTGSDASGVEYLFTETSGNPGGSNSSWQSSASYTDSGLSPSTTYSYTVTMRDSLGNTGSASAAASATTQAAADTTAPNPNPMTWAVAPVASGGPWTPADLTTALWLDAADAATITESGGAVSQWSDKSGNGNDAVQATGSDQPTTGSATINGLNTLDFDGASDRLDINNLAISNEHTVYAVGYTVNSSGYREILRGQVIAADMHFGQLNGNCSTFYGNGASWADVSANTPSGTSTSAFINGVVADGAGSATPYHNGNVQGNKSCTMAGTTTGFSIGSVQGTNFWDGPIAEVIVCSSALSTSDRQKLEGYLAWKWGLEENLPAGHPYESAAPGGSGALEITMTATTATDISGVEYYFTETSGNPGGSDSGWQDSPTYTDTGLSPDTQYTYTVTARDKSSNQNQTSASSAASATTGSSSGGDTTPPTPNPASFASAPSAGGTSTISMTATTGSDASGVEYLFTETSGNAGGSSSSWQTSASYTDSGLSPSTQYSYTVTMRDSLGNTGSASAAASATTQASSDTTPPTPNPASFASAPAAISDSAISMTATTGSDASGVEYLFTETSGNAGGSNSSWQTSPVYNDSGLAPDTQYTYTVTMRDSLGNTGSASSAASATTQSSAGLDAISVNFYAYGAMDPADYDKVTLEAGESAGVGAYNTNGWQNQLASHQSAVGITGNLGSTATLAVNDLRNGSPYNWTAAHTNLPGDGNGDLMDGHCNGTEDPYDGSYLFDMAVTNITYAVYDVIVYLGGNSAQFGDGTGKIVLNGGAEQDFTLTSGQFSSFAEITNGSTPGNYIVFTGLRDPSFTLKVWGNGFNHIGPTGFQIVKDSSGLIPPGPASNPAPLDGVVGLPSNTDLSWTAGLDATSRDVYFGTDSTPDVSEFQGNQTATTFDPGTLANGTYYWRIDEVNADGTTAGPVWSFTVGPPAKAFRPMPWNNMSAVSTDVGLLSWVAGESASTVTHDVYFGTDSTPDASEFQGNQTATTFGPGALSPGTTYYWRVDEVNAQGTTTGDVWSFTTPVSGSNKVKIFIMAGQSNTEGHGEMSPSGTQGTLEHLYNSDPGTYAHLKDGGSWAVRTDAWISYKRGGTTQLNGGLSAGYGSSSSTVGPELQFGHAMGDHHGENVLIIKTAWGGKSLRTDFRPPSSGWSIDTPVTAGDEGYYYTQMLEAVVDATANISANFPLLNPADGYEIAGFAWHQGWNDYATPAFSAEYEANMANFITDVRSSLGVPNLPFVIATTGMDGNAAYSEVELAQLAMENFTAYPQFDGNVAVTDTQSFFFDVASSPADQGYHWNRNAKSYYLIGEAMAAEMVTLLAAGQGPDTSPPTPNPASFASAPAAISDSAISMTATTGSDASGVEYLFTETSGNPGGTSSSWQASPSYTDSGLNPSTQYTYAVTMRDSLGNTGSASAAASATTSASTVTVPNVVGLLQSAAESAITSASLTVGNVTTAISGSVPAGDVISQGLAAGSSVPVNSAVDLVVSLGASSAPKLVRTTVSNVSSASWTTVSLGQTYNSAVIIATPIYTNNTDPSVVTRITNVTSTGFDLKIDRVDGQAGEVTIDVSVIAVDEGVYTVANDGVKMEAVKYTSTVTSRKGSANWVGEARSYQNSYTAPAVVGQVMSANDTGWSAFWSMGATRQDPVDAANLNVGKHVAEDTNTTRADEIIGYIVIESGSGSIDGVAYEAGLGGDTVQGPDNSATPYTYSLSGGLSSASAAAVSISGMDGNNGAWGVLAGNPAFTTTSIGMYALECQMADSERFHTHAQMSYLVFE